MKSLHPISYSRGLLSSLLLMTAFVGLISTGCNKDGNSPNAGATGTPGKSGTGLIPLKVAYL
ncbi:MAG TPA: hypothetical protein VGH32_10475, partial [Pirellulales bacterium]